MNNDNDLVMWILVIAIIFFMAIWAVVGFFIIRWGIRLTRFGKKAVKLVNTAGTYPRMSAGLIQPRNPRPQHIVEVREYDL